MNHLVPQNNDIHQYPSSSELKNILSHYSSNETIYIDIARFVEFLQVLPSSWAGAERIFARMRDIFSKNQTRLSPKSLRTNLIVSFYAAQESPEESFENNDYWFLNEEEEQEELEEQEEEEEDIEGEKFDFHPKLILKSDTRIKFRA